MKNQVTVLRAALSFVLAAFVMQVKADILICDFIQPFLTFKFNTERGTGYYEENGIGDKPFVMEMENLFFSPNGTGKWTIAMSKFQLPGDIEESYHMGQMEINVLERGSNGISDPDYTYDVFLYDWKGREWLRGGCDSSIENGNFERYQFMKLKDVR